MCIWVTVDILFGDNFVLILAGKILIVLDGHHFETELDQHILTKLKLNLKMKAIKHSIFLTLAIRQSNQTHIMLHTHK